MKKAPMVENGKSDVKNGDKRQELTEALNKVQAENLKKFGEEFNKLLTKYEVKPVVTPVFRDNGTVVAKLEFGVRRQG